MLILLPPSETKRAGGDARGEARPLALGSLGFSELTEIRADLVADLAALSADHDAAVKALKLGPKQAAEVDRNRELRSSPTLPALLRYTGVLYDALDAEAFTETEWAFATAHVAVQSALFGLVRASDAIPAYRLSCDSRLSPSLKKRWAVRGAAALASTSGVIIDLRSEGYAALAPLPDREGAHYVRVLARDESGTVRALNHFNKQAKGLLARALIAADIPFASTAELLDWAANEGYELAPAAEGGRDLELVVPEVAGSPGKLRAVLRVA